MLQQLQSGGISPVQLPVHTALPYLALCGASSTSSVAPIALSLSQRHAWTLSASPDLADTSAFASRVPASPRPNAAPVADTPPPAPSAAARPPPPAAAASPAPVSSAPAPDDAGSAAAGSWRAPRGASPGCAASPAPEAHLCHGSGYRDGPARRWGERPAGARCGCPAERLWPEGEEDIKDLMFV